MTRDGSGKLKGRRGKKAKAVRYRSRIARLMRRGAVLGILGTGLLYIHLGIMIYPFPRDYAQFAGLSA